MHRDPVCNEQWELERKLFKTASNFFLYMYQLLIQTTFYRQLVISGGFVYDLESCKVSKDAEYCIIYENLKQGVFLFLIFFFLFVCGEKNFGSFLFITIFM
ncbi:chromobox protein-like protein 7 [Platysternon megacephalum]|uniref:Chromobox protein-like protein 7 n=1 Tax=Platysternon megacephalum TaxID=55544 RepID=A0A4D9EPH7_9SAUR|nr:chromobox protein-like protein 7 [Platysternon megacephalum]